MGPCWPLLNLMYAKGSSNIARCKISRFSWIQFKFSQLQLEYDFGDFSPSSSTVEEMPQNLGFIDVSSFVESRGEIGAGWFQGWNEMDEMDINESKWWRSLTKYKWRRRLWRWWWRRRDNWRKKWRDSNNRNNNNSWVVYAKLGSAHARLGLAFDCPWPSRNPKRIG